MEFINSYHNVPLLILFNCPLIIVTILHTWDGSRRSTNLDIFQKVPPDDPSRHFLAGDKVEIHSI